MDRFTHKESDMDEKAPKLEEMFADVWDGYNLRIHEDVSPPVSKHAHRRLPRAYPALPSFGICTLVFGTLLLS